MRPGRATLDSERRAGGQDGAPVEGRVIGLHRVEPPPAVEAPHRVQPARAGRRLRAALATAKHQLQPSISYSLREPAAVAREPEAAV